jgi:hypothetical protein
MVYSLTLPQPGDFVWKPSSGKRGLPGGGPAEPASRDIWQWLAVLGALGLLADWILYGRMRTRYAPPTEAARGVHWRKAS